MSLLTEKELTEKASELIRGMSAFKIHQILGVLKDIISKHLIVPDNKIAFYNLFTIENTKESKYSINEKKTVILNKLRISPSRTIKRKINEQSNTKIR